MSGVRSSKSAALATYRVTGPMGDVDVVGCICRDISYGLLNFVNADGAVTDTFSPGGWWRVTKVGPSPQQAP